MMVTGQLLVYVPYFFWYFGMFQSTLHLKKKLNIFKRYVKGTFWYLIRKEGRTMMGTFDVPKYLKVPDTHFLKCMTLFDTFEYFIVVFNVLSGTL